MKRVDGWGERVVEKITTTNLPSKMSTLTAARAGYNMWLVHSQERYNLLHPRVHEYS